MPDADFFYCYPFSIVFSLALLSHFSERRREDREGKRTSAKSKPGLMQINWSGEAMAAKNTKNKK